MTNHSQTHCLSTHLTTFTSTLIFLPDSIQWNNLESKEKNLIFIYMNIICFELISLFLFQKIKEVGLFDIHDFILFILILVD